MHALQLFHICLESTDKVLCQEFNYPRESSCLSLNCNFIFKQFAASLKNAMLQLVPSIALVLALGSRAWFCKQCLVVQHRYSTDCNVTLHKGESGLQLVISACLLLVEQCFMHVLPI